VGEGAGRSLSLAAADGAGEPGVDAAGPAQATRIAAPTRRSLAIRFMTILITTFLAATPLSFVGLRRHLDPTAVWRIVGCDDPACRTSDAF
jgi:hypothetical protein